MIEDVKSVAVAPGEIAFVWFNKYSGVVVKTPHAYLVIDPVDVSPSSLDFVDAVLITHEHYDHLHVPTVVRIHELTNCPVIADKGSYPSLKGKISEEKLKMATVGSTFEIRDAKIRAFESKHPAMEPLTYLIEAGGVRLYHTSDSAPFPGMEKLRAYDVDLCFCTVGIAPGASPRYGVEIAKFVKPKCAVPYHGRGLEEFCRILSEEAPDIKCFIADREKPYKYPF